MSQQTSVVELSVDQYPAWKALLAESPDGSVYHQPEYLGTSCASAGGRFRILGAMQAEELVGGVALYERDSPFGAFVAPRLLLYYNGLVLRRYDTKYPSHQSAHDVATLSALVERLESLGFGSIKPRNPGTMTDIRSVVVRGWRRSATGATT